MNRSEFDRWLSDYVGKFPSTGIWLAELGEPTTTAQRQLWADILEPVSLVDAKRATLAMARGEFPAVGSTHADRERTPHFVRDTVRAMKREEAAEAETVHPDDEPGYIRRAAGRAPVGVLERYIELQAKGLTPAEISAEIFGPSKGETGPRYKCAPCRDRGWRLVWHYRSMDAWLAGQLNTEPPYTNHSTMVVPCNCSAGEARCADDGEQERKGRRGSGKPPRSMMFDIEKYCPVGSGGVTTPAAILEFGEWCKEYFAERERLRLLRMEYEETRFK